MTPGGCSKVKEDRHVSGIKLLSVWHKGLDRAKWLFAWNEKDMNCCSPSMNWALPCSSSFCKPGWLKAYFLRLKWLSSLKKKEKKGSMLFIFNTEAILSAWNGFWSGHRKAPQRESEKLPVVIIFIFACYPLVIFTEKKMKDISHHNHHITEHWLCPGFSLDLVPNRQYLDCGLYMAGYWAKSNKMLYLQTFIHRPLFL